MIRWIHGFFWLAAIALSPVGAEETVQSLLQNRMNTPLLRAEGTLTGEGLCWHAAYDMDRFMDEYRTTSDPAFLDAAVQYYDALIGKMHVSPDGFKGWVGPYIYDEKYICDVHVGDAILINPMLDFSEIVLKRSPEKIRQTYQAKAQSYVDLARQDLIEKWDVRGTWREDGPYGAYVSWDRYMTSDNLEEWQTIPVSKSTLSLPFNKQNTLAIACLRLYRITGENAYREKALKIFNFMKSRMCLFQDHYVWNYWEPFGPWDIDPDKPNTLNHWVNVHPYRNYQAGEIDQIVEAYHSGITFTKDDLQHIINTNLKVMWNGDKDRPQWHNSNYAVEMASMGKISIARAPGGEFPELAGTLWRGLADFDPTIRALAKLPPKETLSFDRAYPEFPVSEFSFPFHDHCDLNLAVLLPCHLTKGQSAFLVSQSRVPGAVKIDLYSSEGQTRIKTLRDEQKEDPEGLLILPWADSDIPSGDYRIRWTIRGGYREFPISIQ